MPIWIRTSLRSARSTAARQVRMILIGVSALIAATPAFAVSVTNRDDKEYKLTVVEGDVKADRILKPLGSLEGICLKGCVIRLGDSENDEYELEGTEVVSIEDGYLYYDGPEGGAEVAPGGNAQPPPSKSSPPGASGQ